MQRCWILFVILVLTALPAEAGAVEKVKEPATGIEFDATLDGGYQLLGLGVRKKFAFKVYATALYVKVPDAVEPLKAAKSPFGPIIRGTFPRKMVMHFTLAVSGAKAKETFRKNFDRVMAPEKMAKCLEDRQRYLEAMGGDIEKGQRYVMDYAEGRIQVSLAGRRVYETANPAMIEGIFSIWYGPEPLDEKLKQDLVSRLRDIID
ncbi:MAG: chalcone isomerase family protein [Pseudomonadota bacterium]